MKNTTMRKAIGILSLLLVTVILSALETWQCEAQTTDHIVINEVAQNPVGDDNGPGAEWVELFNPLTGSVNLSGWNLTASRGTPRTISLTANVSIAADGYLIINRTGQWLENEYEVVVLTNPLGVEIDRARNMTDTSDDARAWARVPNGRDFDQDSDWSLQQSTKGFSNNRISPSTVESWDFKPHLWILNTAYRLLPREIQDVWQYYPIELADGVAYPIKHSWNSTLHFYHSHTNWGGALNETLRWYRYFVDNQTAGNLPEAVFSAGVMAHYIIDISNPFNTNQSLAEESIHTGYKSYVERDLPYFQIEISELDGVKNVSAYLIALAHSSQTYYSSLIESFTPIANEPYRWSGETHRITSICLNAAVRAVVSLWLTAIEKGYLATPEFNLAKRVFLIATPIVLMAALAIKRMPTL
jgi:hypothetical protein